MVGKDFWLYPEGLRGQAEAFSSWAESAGSARSWVDAHPIRDAAEHWAYSRGATVAIEVREGLIPWFAHLESVLAGVANELKDVAREGTLIDLEQQAELDGIDPGTYVGFERHLMGGGDLLPRDERVEETFPVFTPPNGGAGYYCDFGPKYDHINDLSKSIVPDDLLSPSGWVLTVLGWLGAPDIGDEVMRAFGGRWGDLRQFADTLGGLHNLVLDMHARLASAAGYIDILWQGFAAASAQEYFTALLTSLDDAARALARAAQEFTTFCDGIEEAAAATADALQTFVDAVIFAAVAAALGTATIESFVGGVIGYGGAGAALLFAYIKLYEVRDTLQNLLTIAALLDSINAINSTLENFTSTIPVPAMVDAP